MNSSASDREFFIKTLESLELSEAYFLPSETLIGDLVDLLKEKGFGSILMGTKEGKAGLQGIFTEKDVVHVLIDREDLMKESLVDYATPNPLFLDISNSVEEVTNLFRVKGFRHLPVFDEGLNSYRMISTRDILKAYYQYHEDFFNHLDRKPDYYDQYQIQEEEYIFNIDKNNSGRFFHLPISRFIFRHAVTVDINESVINVLEKMIAAGESAVVVMEYQTLLKGIATERDIMRKMIFEGNFDGSKKIGELMTADPDCFKESQHLSQAILKMHQNHYRHVLVVDAEGHPLSTVSFLDVLRFIGFYLEQENQI